MGAAFRLLNRYRESLNAFGEALRVNRHSTQAW